MPRPPRILTFKHPLKLFTASLREQIKDVDVILSQEIEIIAGAKTAADQLFKFERGAGV